MNVTLTPEQERLIREKGDRGEAIPGEPVFDALRRRNLSPAQRTP